MNKAKEAQTILEVHSEMMQTIANIRDAEKNADYFYPADKIINNMNQYFTGLAFVLEKITGKEYHWSTTDKITYSLVIIDGKDETYIPVM